MSSTINVKKSRTATRRNFLKKATRTVAAIGIASTSLGQATTDNQESANMAELFTGTLYFVQVAFRIQGNPNTVFRVSTADMNTAINYTTRAVVPISLYASQYGPNSITVHPTFITYNLPLSQPSLDDAQLQVLVNDVASRLPSDACVLVLLPPGIDNTSYSRFQGTGGYHRYAKVPYINSYIDNDQQGSTSLTVQDVSFRYAGALSHEIAEMVVDPRVDGHPEVCDPCGPNYVSTYLNYFDDDGNYITTTQTPPYDPNLGFQYNFYINGIVQPPFAKPQAAPASACSYAPVPIGVAPLQRLPGRICCDAFYSPDDSFRHAIVGSGEGAIDEVFFHPQRGRGLARLGTVRGLVDAGCFYTSDDHFRHVVTVSSNGDVGEWFYHPQAGSGHSVIGNVVNAFRICGFQSGDDGYRHAIVGTSEGDIFELFYHPAHGIGRVLLGSFANLVDIGAFYSPDDHFRHVILATKEGEIIEIFYSPSQGKGQTTIARVDGLVRLSAYFVEKDLYNRRVQVATSAGELIEVRYNPRAATLKVRLSTPSQTMDIGSFYSEDDAYRHSICLLATGEVEEVFFKI